MEFKSKATRKEDNGNKAEFNRTVNDAVIEEVKKQLHPKQKASWGGLGLGTGGIGAIIIFKLIGFNPASMEFVPAKISMPLENRMQAVEVNFDKHIALQAKDQEYDKMWKISVLEQLKELNRKVNK